MVKRTHKRPPSDCSLSRHQDCHVSDKHIAIEADSLIAVDNTNFDEQHCAITPGEMASQKRIKKHKMCIKYITKACTVQYDLCTTDRNFETTENKRKCDVRPNNQYQSAVFGSLLWIVSVFCVLQGLLRPAGCFNIDTTKFRLYKNPDVASMFGFTVSQFREDGRDWLLVGAPEASTSQPGVTRPGAVYKCPADNIDECRQIVFDREGNEFRYDPDIRQERQVSNKTLQWFGASLDSSSQNGQIVACAPRYVYFTHDFDKREPIGVCMLYENGVQFIRTYYPCKTGLWSYDRQGFCQAGGFGLDLTEDGEKIVIGAVGSYYWQGQVIVQDVEQTYDVQETPEANKIYDNSYRGYTLSLGDFDGDGIQDIAASAPKALSHNGMVQLFRRTPSDVLNFYNITGPGDQIGEYFGYSLAVADFNDDGLDDIAVGAPLYMDDSANTYEMGHVYVYYQTATHAFVERHMPLTGKKETRSRFGSSTASIGDVDDDGYNDLAVGAPYGGADSKGAVYIFQGSWNGIIEKYSQIIEARGLSTTLSTFGFSISGGMDQDRNQYPDVAVGAYEFAEAVLLRTRPVIRVNTEMSSAPNTIILEKKDCHQKNGSSVTCFTLETCNSYSGKAAPSRISLRVSWQLDYLKRQQEARVFYLEGSEKERVRESTVDIARGEKFCTKAEVYVKGNIRDKLSPIYIQFNYSLLEDRAPGDQLQPILDYYISKSVQTSASIKKNCGADEICIPDLKLAVFSENPRYIYEQKKELQMAVFVENLGEESYETVLNVDLPTGVTYVNIDKIQSKTQVICTSVTNEERGNQFITCDLGNPLPAGQNVRFNIRMYPKDIDPDLDALVLHCNVTSTNPENDTDLFNNVAHLNIQLAAVVDIGTHGVSLPEQVLYNITKVDVILTEMDVGPNFTHRYVITNIGPSSLSTLITDIYWPETLADGSLMFYLSDVPQVVQGDGYCQADIIDIDNITDMAHKPQEEGGIFESVLMTIFGGKSDEKTSNDQDNIFRVSCDIGQPEVCKQIHCETGPMAQSDSIVIEVKGRVFINTLAEVLKMYRGVFAMSLGRAEVGSLPYKNLTMEEITEDTFQVETFVTAIDIGAGSKQVAWWVITLAVIGGSILLMLMVVLLWKCGFFKRNKLEDEQKLADKEEEQEMASVEDGNNKDMKNGKAKASTPPRVQVAPESKELYKSVPDDDF